MKLAIALGILVLGYFHYLHTWSDTALSMTNQLNGQYAEAVNHPDRLLAATDRNR